MVLEWCCTHIHPRGLEHTWIRVEIDHATTKKSHTEGARVVAIVGRSQLLLELAR